MTPPLCLAITRLCVSTLYLLQAKWERGSVWTTHELRNLRTHFRYYLDKEKLPKMPVCKAFLEKYETKRDRDADSVYRKVLLFRTKKNHYIWTTKTIEDDRILASSKILRFIYMYYKEKGFVIEAVSWVCSFSSSCIQTLDKTSNRYPSTGRQLQQAE